MKGFFSSLSLSPKGHTIHSSHLVDIGLFPAPQRGDGETFHFCILILVVEGKESDPFGQVQVSVLNKVGPMWLIYDYLSFWSISLFQISPSEIIMSWMSFASGIYFLVVPE